MRKFLTSCLWFGLIVIALWLGCEWLIRTRVLNPYRYKHEWMQANASRVGTLILGNSHTYYGVSPGELDSCAFSLANVSQTFRYDYLLLTHYPGLGDSLKRVVLAVSYCSFFDQDLDTPGGEWEYAPNYKIYMGLDTHSDFSKYNFEISRPTTFGKKLQALLKGHELSCDSLGHGLGFETSARDPNWRLNAEATARRHTAADDSAVAGEMFYARKIAEWCRKRGVKLILVTTPAAPEYWKRLDRRQLAVTDSLARRLATDYDAVYLSYLTDARFGDEDFHDSDHLSSDIGAQKFTRILKEDIRKSESGHNK